MCIHKNLQFPCGKCYECLQSRRNDWAIRLQYEVKKYDSRMNYFLTLTYDNNHLPIKDNVPTLSKRDIELFIKRLRFYVAPCRFKFFMCGEYCPSSGRPHYHCIIFGFPDRKFKRAVRLFNKAWKNGQVRKPWRLVPAQCVYATKYLITDDFTPDGAQKPFNKMSKGLGDNILTNLNPWLYDEQYIKDYAKAVWDSYSKVIYVDSSHNGDSFLVARSVLIGVPQDIIIDFGSLVQDFIRHETNKGLYKFKIPKYIRQKFFSKEVRELLNLYQTYLRGLKQDEYNKKYFKYDCENPGNPMWKQQARIKEEKKLEYLNKKYKDFSKYLK